MKIKHLLLSTAATASLLVLGATAANADTITVKAGDTVSALALTHHTTIAAIGSENALADVNLIIVGQKLAINATVAPVRASAPAKVAVTPAKPAPRIVTPAQAPTAPVQTPAAAPVRHTTPVRVQAAPVQTGDHNSAAKAWIANKESGGSYTARNGQYIGKYQLSAAYLNGDYSAANQERVAESYVANRYGSWAAAQNFWQAHGWY